MGVADSNEWAKPSVLPVLKCIVIKDCSIRHWHPVTREGWWEWYQCFWLLLQVLMLISFSKAPGCTMHLPIKGIITIKPRWVWVPFDSGFYTYCLREVFLDIIAVQLHVSTHLLWTASTCCASAVLPCGCKAGQQKHTWLAANECSHSSSPSSTSWGSMKGCRRLKQLKKLTCNLYLLVCLLFLS